MTSTKTHKIHKIYPYVLLVDRPNGWRVSAPEELLKSDFLLSQNVNPTEFVPKGTLVEFDPLCFPMNTKFTSINVISLDDQQVKASVLMRELEQLESEQYELLVPLAPSQRFDLISSPKWKTALEIKIGDTVWFYRSSKAASVSVKSRQNGSYGHISNSSMEKDVGFVRYIGPLEGRSKGHWIGIELFLEANRGDHDGQGYFQAPAYSSVFTKINHVFVYDEDEDIEQIRQKIGIFRASVEDLQQQQQHKSKKTVWKKFQMDRQANQESQQRVLGHSHQQQQQTNYQDYCDRSSYSEKVVLNNNTSLAKKEDLSKNEPLVRVNDRIVWLSDDGPEYGVVKWIGVLPDADVQEVVAGIEFDNEVGHGSGFYNNQQFFQGKPGHSSFVPLCGLLKAEDFENGPSGSGSSENSIKRRNKKMVDELDLKRRSNSQQQHLADYKMKQNLNRLKNSSNGSHEGGSSRAGTDDNFSPSILGSLEQDIVNWTPSTQSSPPRQNRFPISPERKNDLSLIGTPQELNPSQPARDPYASEDLIVAAEVHKEKNVEELAEKLPEFLRLQEVPDPDPELGTLVELHVLDYENPLYGVIKWIGDLGEPAKMAGIELEEELVGATNGWHNGTQMFACPDRKAVFVPLTHLMPDKRFEIEPKLTNGHNHLTNGATNGLNEFGDMDCPVVPGFHCPIRPDDLGMFYGRNRGIQGHQNSCYLDATLFVMFSFTSVFDCLLYRPPNTQDIAEYCEVQRVLREEIVNPLRKNWFVRADRVMKLRQLLDSLTSVRGLMSEEKDPEELLNSLLSQTLKASPFLDLSSGQHAHLYQLFVERDENKSLPSVQELFEQSFLTSGVKLKKVPSVLILQMPRFGRQFKVYDRILPSQILDVTDVIEDAPRQCIVCGKLAGWECADCFGDHGEGLDSTAFCDTCISRVHNHIKRRNHKTNQLRVPQEYIAQGYSTNEGHNPRLYMELFAVMCIETSHYVSFVKCGLGPDAPWCFFDSMADRKGEQNGYNIPEVTAAPHVSKWLTDEGVKLLNKCKDDKMLPDHAKRLICDGYMCFYQSPQVMMYQ